MDKPIEPVLARYNLSQDDVKTLPSPDKFSKCLSIAFAICLIAYWCRGIFEKDSNTPIVLYGLVSYFLFLPAAAVFGVIVYKIAQSFEKSFHSNRNPRFRSYCLYRDDLAKFKIANREYNLWEAKRQEGFWRSLSGIQFEVELGKLFVAMGFEVQQTPRTGDGGVDLLVRKNGRLTIVQCKAHQKKIAIGAIRELSACLQDFNAQDAIIACFEGVTKPVLDYIKDKPITVLTLPQIVELQRKHS